MRTVTIGRGRNSTVLVPETMIEVREHFGEDRKNLARTVALQLPEPIGRLQELYVHPLACRQFDLFFRRIFVRKLWSCIVSIGPVLSAKNLNGKYPAQPSLHQWGAALTINAERNLPRVKVIGQPREVAGVMFWAGHPIVEIARNLGIRWGGDRRSYVEPAEFELYWGN